MKGIIITAKPFLDYKDIRFGPLEKKIRWRHFWIMNKNRLRGKQPVGRKEILCFVNGKLQHDILVKYRADLKDYQ